MTRFHDWQTGLHEYLLSAVHRPFQYATFDCVHHSANAILAMTGTDILAAVRGKYDSLLTSQRLLKAYGGTVESASSLIATRYNMPEVPSFFAQRGDLVLVDQHGEALSGVVDLNGLISAVTTKGYLLLDLKKATRAWRV